MRNTGTDAQLYTDVYPSDDNNTHIHLLGTHTHTHTGKCTLTHSCTWAPLTGFVCDSRISRPFHYSPLRRFLFYPEGSGGAELQDRAGRFHKSA